MPSVRATSLPAQLPDLLLRIQNSGTPAHGREAGSTIVQLWDSSCGTGKGSFEVGPRDSAAKRGGFLYRIQRLFVGSHRHLQRCEAHMD
jgi:hypothetical protein